MISRTGSATAFHDSDREIGIFPARYRAEHDEFDLRALKSALQDLAGGDRKMLASLTHLIELPGFIAFDQDSSPASCLARRDALLQDLSDLFQPALLVRIRSFLDGYVEGKKSEKPTTQTSPSPARNHSTILKASPESAGNQPVSLGSHVNAPMENIGGSGNFNAVEDYDLVLISSPHSISALINRGNLKSVSGDLHGAILDYNHVLMINPRSALAFLNRGVALQALGDYESAFMDWRHAAALGNDTAEKWLK